MNSTEASNLIKNFFEMLNKKEYKELENYLSPDVVFYFPGTKPLCGPKKVMQLFHIIYRSYPDLSFKINDIIIEEKKVATTGRIQEQTDTAIPTKMRA